MFIQVAPNCISTPIACIVNLVTFCKEALSYCQKTELSKVILKPHPFCESNSDTSQKLESKIHICFLDDGNLADDYKVVLRDLRNILKS